MDIIGFTDDHDYVRSDGKTARIGITDHAQSQLGEIVFVELPSIGQHIKKGDVFAVVESVKAANEISSPISGTVTAVNSRLEDAPDTLNTDAENNGWIIEISVENAPELDSLLDADAYSRSIDGSN